MLPLMKPALAVTVSIFAFISVVETTSVRCSTSRTPDLATMPLALRSTSTRLRRLDYGAQMAMAVLALVPVPLFFLRSSGTSSRARRDAGPQGLMTRAQRGGPASAGPP